MSKTSSVTSDLSAHGKSPQTGGKLKVSQEPTLGVSPVDQAVSSEAVLSEASELSSPVSVSTQPEAVSEVQVENFGPLPATYNTDTLFLTARDPRWLFSYWDFDWGRVSGSEMRDGRRCYYIRVNRVLGQGADHEESVIEINPVARNWYIPVAHAGATYRCELGYFDRAGGWCGMVQSGEAHTPMDALAPESTGEEHFATVPPKLTFARLQEMVDEHMQEGETLLEAIARITGEGRIQLRAGDVPVWGEEQKRLLALLLGDNLIDVMALGSDEIDRLLRKALQDKLHSETASGLSGEKVAAIAGELAPSSFDLTSLSSPMGASWSGAAVGRDRGFFMHLNAEIIFYGGTAPDASVTVNGQPITLKPDGTFRYHFTLPDGDFEIPVVARSADGVEERAGTLSFRRGTQRVGDVGSTGQPRHLEPLIGRK